MAQGAAPRAAAITSAAGIFLNSSTSNAAVTTQAAHRARFLRMDVGFTYHETARPAAPSGNTSEPRLRPLACPVNVTPVRERRREGGEARVAGSQSGTDRARFWGRRR